jgi:hypothetical protein
MPRLPPDLQNAAFDLGLPPDPRCSRAKTQLGVVIGVGVLLETLLVRTVVVPAFGVWLGDGFWWPRRVVTGPAIVSPPEVLTPTPR